MLRRAHPRRGSFSPFEIFLGACPGRRPAADGAARLGLQAVLHRLYDSAGYEDFIYDGAPRPPLSAADAAWAAGLVPGRQRDGRQA
jgi:hypothetical protein